MSDFLGGSLRRLNFRTGIPSIVYEGPAVGAFLPQEDGTWLLFREKDIALLDFDRHAQVVPLIENVRVDGDRFSEVIADAEGRVLAGTLRAGRPNGAGIYRLGEGEPLAKLLGGTGEAGGMCWNVAGDALYWTCGTTRTICRCRYDAKRGALSNRQVSTSACRTRGRPPDWPATRRGPSGRRGAIPG